MDKPIKPVKPKFPTLTRPVREYHEVLLIAKVDDQPCLITEEQYAEQINKGKYPWLYYDSCPLSPLTVLVAAAALKNPELFMYWRGMEDGCFAIQHIVTLSNEEFNERIRQYMEELKHRTKLELDYTQQLAEYKKQKTLYDYEQARRKVEEL